MRRVVVMVAALAVVVAVAAVVLLGSPGGEATSAHPPPGIPVGVAAPPFSLAGLKAQVTSTEFRHRRLVLAFITPACPRCANDMRRLGALAARDVGPAGAPNARTHYVVVDRGRTSAGRIAEFTASAGVGTGPMFASDPTGAAWHAYRVTSPGTVFVIGADGRVAWRSIDPALRILRTQVQKIGTPAIRLNGLFPSLFKQTGRQPTQLLQLLNHAPRGPP